MSRRIDRPILGGDVVGVLPFLLDIPLGYRAETRAEKLRRAELLRRFYPDDAIALLDALPPGEDPACPLLHPAVIRAHALLEQGKWGAATVVVPELPAGAGVRALVLGRLAIARGDLDGATAYLTTALDEVRASEEPLAPEVAAEALSLRGRLLLTRDQDEAGTADLLALEELAATHDAPLTRGTVSVLRDAIERGNHQALAEALAAIQRRLAEGRYARPHEALRQQIAPIPLHVHGALVAHQHEPAAFVDAVLQLSALAWRVGDHIAGLETALYGQRIGARRFGEAAVSNLQVYLDALREREGEEVFQELVAAVERRAAEARARRESAP